METKEITIQDLKPIYVYDWVDSRQQIFNNTLDPSHPERSDTYVWDFLLCQVHYTMSKAQLSRFYGDDNIFDSKDWNFEDIIKKIWHRKLKQLGIVSRDYLIHRVRLDDKCHHELKYSFYYYSSPYYRPRPVNHADVLKLSDDIIPRLSIIDYLLDITNRASNYFKYSITDLVARDTQEQMWSRIQADIHFLYSEVNRVFQDSIVEANQTWGAHDFVSRESILNDLHTLQDQKHGDSVSLVAQRIRAVESKDDVLYDNQMGAMFAQPIDANGWTKLVGSFIKRALRIIIR